MNANCRCSDVWRMLVGYVGCTRHQYLCWMGTAAACIAAPALAVVVGVLPVEYCLGIVRTFAHAEVQEPLRWMHLSLLLNVVLFEAQWCHFITSGC